MTLGIASMRRRSNSLEERAILCYLYGFSLSKARSNATCTRNARNRCRWQRRTWCSNGGALMRLKNTNRVRCCPPLRCKHRSRLTLIRMTDVLYLCLRRIPSQPIGTPSTVPTCPRIAIIYGITACWPGIREELFEHELRGCKCLLPMIMIWKWTAFRW